MFFIYINIVYFVESKLCCRHLSLILACIPVPESDLKQSDFIRHRANVLNCEHVKINSEWGIKLCLECSSLYLSLRLFLLDECQRMNI